MKVLQLEQLIEDCDQIIKLKFDEPNVNLWKKSALEFLRNEFSDKPDFHQQLEEVFNPKKLSLGNFQTMHQEQMRHTKLLLQSFLDEIKKNTENPETIKEITKTLESIITTYSNNFPAEGNDFLFLLEAYQKCIDFAITKFGRKENIMMLSAHHYDWALKGDKLKEATKNIVSKATSLKQLVSSQIGASQTDSSNNDFAKLENIFYRFHEVAKQLSNRRRQSKKPYLIKDEYDVQDLLHALLKIHFKNIKPEEPNPSTGGSYTFGDFSIPEIETLVEVKLASDDLENTKLTKQIAIDKEHYKKNPKHKTVYFFIYDPDGFVKNPVGFEEDLSEVYPNFSFKIIIAPRS